MCTIPWNHCPTSSPTVSTLPYFFLWNFPYFITIFHLQKHPFPYLEVHNGPGKQWAPLLSSPMHPTALPEWLQHVQKNDKFFAGTRTLNTPTDQKNISLPHLFHKIYSKAMPAQKYIFKVWQWHLRVHPPKIYPYHISLTKYILQVWHRHYNFCVTFQGPCVKNIF